MKSLRVRLILMAATLVAGALALTPAAPRLEALDTAAYRVVLPSVARDGGPGDVVLDNPNPYPTGTRTGILAIDAVLGALEAETQDPFEALFDLTPAPCVIDPQSLTNPPICPEGVAAGTLIPVFRATACESIWPHYLDELLRDSLWKWPRPVLAIYRDPTDAYSWLPAADYAIIVVPESAPGGGGPVVVRVSAGRVNGIEFGCGHTFGQLTAGIEEARYVLPPQR